MSRAASISSQSMKSAAGKDANDLLSIFHALAISCESAMARSCFGDFSPMISELGKNLEAALPKELLRSAARKRSVEQCALLLTDFLMVSNRFGAIELSADGDDVYCRFPNADSRRAGCTGVSARAASFVRWPYSSHRSSSGRYGT